jgi:hypothetical protein
MSFSKSAFIAAAKAAAASDNPTQAMRELLAETVQDPAPILAAFADIEADEENFLRGRDAVFVDEPLPPPPGPAAPRSRDERPYRRL